jgi:hypothetical protein
MSYTRISSTLLEIIVLPRLLLRLPRRRVVCAIASFFVASLLPSLRASAQIVQIVSATPAGGYGNANSYDIWLNADGRYAGFTSRATNLVLLPPTPPQTYLRDTCVGSTAPVGCTPATALISVTNAGLPLPAGVRDDARGGTVSSTGRYVLFGSSPADVTGASSNGNAYDYIRDTCIGAAVGCVPQDILGTLAGPGVTQDSFTSDIGDGNSSLSLDGRYVSFATYNQVISSVPASSQAQIYLTDTCIGAASGCTPSTILISALPNGSATTLPNFASALAQSGRYVAFWSFATNLVGATTANQRHYYLRDTCIGAASGCTPGTQIVDINADGTEALGSANDANADQAASLSANGRYVLFMSVSPKLVAGVTSPAVNEVYLRDTCNGAPTGCVPSTILVSATGGGFTGTQTAFSGPHSLSSDGRYAVFAATPLGANAQQIYMRDTCIGAPAGCVPATALVSADPNNVTGGALGFSVPVISGDGQYVAFQGGFNPPTYYEMFLAKAPVFASPAAAFTPNTLTYTTVVNTQAYNQTTTLSNAGSGTLAISSIAISGANASSFNIVTDNCGATLAPGANCSVTVGFTAITAGTYTATLTATDNATSITQTVALTGTVNGIPAATLTPTSLTFSTVPGKTAATQTATLSNTGTAALSISSIAIIGANASSFSIGSNTCGSSLAVGATCTITVGLTATTVGSYSASLVATDNASPSTQAVPLSGTVAGTPVASLTPATLTFSANAGTTPAAQTATLTNTGNAPLSITSIAFSGTSAAAFSQTSTCGVSLAAGASCTLSITFTSANAGSFTASAVVTDNSGSSSAGTSTPVTQSVALSATAISVTPPDFTLAATPSTQSSYRGRTVTYTVQIGSLLSTSPFTGTVSLAATGLPAGASASFAPPTVVPGTQAASSVLSVSIPALSSFNRTPPSRPGAGTVTGISLALLLAGFGFRTRHRKLKLPALLTVLGLLGLAASSVGCGSGNGFAVPTSTSTITITGTSGATAHTATVMLTVQ